MLILIRRNNRSREHPYKNKLKKDKINKVLLLKLIDQLALIKLEA